LQVKQIAAGGMHSVAVSMEGQVYTTGVNDEAALGRKTGEHLQTALTNKISEFECIAVFEGSPC